MPKSWKVRQYMSEMPHTVGADQPLSKAEKMMREYKIRHLPVLDGGKLVGILSDRDIKLVESFADVDEDEVTVEEAYTADPYEVSPDTPLLDVISAMIEHKYGSVLVTEKSKLMGIFTWVDGLKALKEALK